jgi:superfamily II DNA or RNA helicase
MVSEGVDIPRLRVGVYATTTTTELFFRQAVGRLVRWTRGVPRQKAYLFIPDDVRLRTWAMQIADARRHSLRRPERDGDEAVDDAALDALVHPDDRGEQLSMFAALSAVVTGAAESSVFDVDEAALDQFDRQEDDAALELALPALPGSAAAGGNGHGDGNGTNPRRERSELRERNARLVQDLVWATGLGHAQINGQLNRFVGLRRIDEATVDQLRRRAREAESWLAKTQQ